MSTDPYRTPGDEPDRSTDDHPTDDHPTVEIPRDTTDSAAEAAPGRSRPRTGTVVWGVVVLAVAVGLLARTAGARIDTELAAILLLATAGLLLVVGSVVGALRRRRGDGR